MTCCGSKRNAIKELAAQQAVTPTGLVIQHRVDDSSLLFLYQGKTTMTVRGMVTQRLYRFAGPGAVVEVDRRDAPGIKAIGGVRRVLADDKQ